ncbi:hypothetical protein V2I01_31645 [Micromonospora sp. BRA006-A]|nr:hypothetical protein [Micromonospora sp. BRA006-A]
MYVTPDRSPVPAVAAPVASPPAAARVPVPGRPVLDPDGRLATLPARVGDRRDRRGHLRRAGRDDDADGSRQRPFATLNRAVAVVRPGQTIALRGGVHRLTRPVEIDTDGTRARRIVLSGYRGERAVLDAAGVAPDKYAVTQRTAFWTVQDLEVRGSRSHAWTCSSRRFTTFRRLSVHDNYRSGLTLRDPGTTGNQVLDSDFYRNYEPGAGGGAGIGLGVKFGDGGGNVVRGNRASTTPTTASTSRRLPDPVTIEDNWSYGNARTGGTPPAGTATAWLLPGRRRDHAVGGAPGTEQRRLGQPRRRVRRGGNTGEMSLAGNTAYHNGGDGFDLSGGRGTARANLSVGNGDDRRCSARTSPPTAIPGSRRAARLVPAIGRSGGGGRATGGRRHPFPEPRTWAPRTVSAPIWRADRAPEAFSMRYAGIVWFHCRPLRVVASCREKACDAFGQSR